MLEIPSVEWQGIFTCYLDIHGFFSHVLYHLIIAFVALLFRGMVDESGDQFVAYFLPTEDTIKKRKRDGEAGVDYEEEDE